VPVPIGWTKTFTDPRLCAAIVDRLTYDATIIETGTTSYRLAHTRAAGAKPPWWGQVELTYSEAGIAAGMSCPRMVGEHLGH